MRPSVMNNEPIWLSWPARSEHKSETYPILVGSKRAPGSLSALSLSLSLSLALALSLSLSLYSLSLYTYIRCRISPGIFFHLPRGFFFLICFVFRPLHLSCHFPSMLHAICSIMALELSILHAICRIWAQEPSIYHAVCRICAQKPFSLRAVCRIWELEPSMLLYLLLRLLLLCLLLCCLLLFLCYVCCCDVCSWVHGHLWPYYPVTCDPILPGHLRP